MIEVDELEHVLKEQFQKQLEFELNGRVYKKGKLVLFRLDTYNNNYEVSFMFDKPNTDKVENFKVPYPFQYEYYPEDDHIFFDYRLNTLTNDNALSDRIRKLTENYPVSKYFDKILKITCNIPTGK
jgi:hypothetical protein